MVCCHLFSLGSTLGWFFGTTGLHMLACRPAGPLINAGAAN